MKTFDATIFDLAPVAMWIEDFSGVKQQFDDWRAAGVEDIRSFLSEDRSRVAACSQRIKVLQVNEKTLELFEARDLEHLVDNLAIVFCDDMLESHVNELAALWDGETEFTSNAVNYSLSGRRMDIQLKGSVLPGHEETLGKILLTTEDVTAREDARRSEIQSRRHAEGLFEYSPVSLWVEDFSAIKLLIEDVRERGIVDFRVFMDVHPEFVRQCMSEIRVIDVNQATLDLFCASDVNTLLRRQPEIFRDEMEKPFREQLMDLWEGKLFHQREVVNYALDGTIRHILLHFAVLPGHEADWSQVQVALTDITARKKAEAYLEYLGKHDILTKLNNRSYFDDELNRLERRGPMPVTIIAADLNGLKDTNDTLGHAAGDALLRRAGEVLREAVQRPATAARIGGDEFVVILPASGEAEGRSMMTAIEELVEVNNQFYGGGHLSLSMGQATIRDGERLEDTVKRADAQMYEAKRAYYLEPKHERRRNRTTPGL